MIAAVRHPEPFGMATIANDLDVARAFYTTLYPYEVMEGVFAGMKYFSVVKDGVTLVNVFQRSTVNPITGTIPILKVDSVAECIRLLQSLGGTVIIPESTCPCTMSSFALCSDREGNQFIIKESTR
jgi:predicted enzyme related to lactoylglutathione lyase